MIKKHKIGAFHRNPEGGCDRCIGRANSLSERHKSNIIVVKIDLSIYGALFFNGNYC